MLDEQKGLLNEYIVLEGLPDYPVNLQEKEGQLIIKEFIGRAIEELSEAYDAMLEAFKAAASNNKKTAIRYLSDYNEEISDFWHFLCEILLYSDMDSDNIEVMIQGYLSENPQYEGFYRDGRPWKFFLQMGGYINSPDDRGCIRNKMDRFTIATEDEMINDPMLCGGRRVSETLIQDHAVLLWQITHELYQLANLLKNRRWTTTERIVNQQQYKYQMVMVLMAVGTYMNFIGLGEIQMVTNFQTKGKVLKARIQEGY